MPYKVEAPVPVPEPAAPLATDQAAEASAVTLTPVAKTPPAAKKPAAKKAVVPTKPAAIKAPAKPRTKKTSQ